jgi:hypothetical protein
LTIDFRPAAFALSDIGAPGIPTAANHRLYCGSGGQVLNVDLNPMFGEQPGIRGHPNRRHHTADGVVIRA